MAPVSEAELIEVGDTLVSTDAATRRRYRVEEGIPRMLIEDSEQLDEGEWKKIMGEAGREV